MLSCCCLYKGAHRGQCRRVSGEEEDALTPATEGFVRKLCGVFALRLTLPTAAWKVAQPWVDAADLLAQLARHRCGVGERLILLSRGKEFDKIGIDVYEQVGVHFWSELIDLAMNGAQVAEREPHVGILEISKTG